MNVPSSKLVQLGLGHGQIFLFEEEHYVVLE